MLPFALGLCVLGVTGLLGQELLRSRDVVILDAAEESNGGTATGDRLQPSNEPRDPDPDGSASASGGAEDGTPGDTADEASFEVVYDPSPIGAPFDKLGHRAYLDLIYADVEVAELESLAWNVMELSNTLSARAFREQVEKGLCNAAISTDGYTPKSVRDRRPNCTYQLQTTTERVELPGAGTALRFVEYYVREDEYPDVFRAREELRWLEQRIAQLGGKGPTSR